MHMVNMLATPFADTYKFGYSGISPIGKSNNVGSGTVTAEYILDQIRALGVDFVGLNTPESLAHKNKHLNEFSRFAVGEFGETLRRSVSVIISPDKLQQLMNDPVFRAEQFANIRSHVVGNEDDFHKWGVSTVKRLLKCLPKSLQTVPTF